MDKNQKILIMADLARLRLKVLEMASSRDRSMMVQKLDECALWLSRVRVKQSQIPQSAEGADRIYQDYYG
jgi:hypothetical protein